MAHADEGACSLTVDLPHVWSPGEQDRRANLKAWHIVLLIALIVGLLLVAAAGVCVSTAIIGLVLGILVLVLVFGIAGLSSGREFHCEEVKHFPIGPDRLSGAIELMLTEDAIPHERSPYSTQDMENYQDRFDLTSPPWSGLAIIVERNPLIARVGIARVSVRSRDPGAGALRELEGRVDRAVERERAEGGEETRELYTPPKYVVFGPMEH